MSPLIATLLVIITSGTTAMAPSQVAMERFQNAASCEAVAERITHRYQLSGGRGYFLAFCVAAS